VEANGRDALSASLGNVHVPASVRVPIGEIVDALVRGDFDLLEADGRAGRVGAGALREAIRDYGRTLVALPEAAYGLIDAVEVTSSANLWQLAVPLWTVEEGRSDLSLELTAVETPDGWGCVIEGLHVL